MLVCTAGQNLPSFFAFATLFPLAHLLCGLLNQYRQAPNSTAGGTISGTALMAMNEEPRTPLFTRSPSIYLRPPLSPGGAPGCDERAAPRRMRHFASGNARTRPAQVTPARPCLTASLHALPPCCPYPPSTPTHLIRISGCTRARRGATGESARYRLVHWGSWWRGKGWLIRILYSLISRPHAHSVAAGSDGDQRIHHHLQARPPPLPFRRSGRLLAGDPLCPRPQGGEGLGATRTRTPSCTPRERGCVPDRPGGSRWAACSYSNTSFALPFYSAPGLEWSG
ncbi:hypothetical protein B0H14DRAFT_865118 [Mycena olivaceomarginata]|nr:hypothetical protein B0H14DRAFT_865118 [Mycena olivaceomarginata]